MTCVEPVWHYWRNLVELATCIDHVANDDEEKKWTLKEGAAHRYMSKERRTDGPSAHQHTTPDGFRLPIRFVSAIASFFPASC